MHLLILYRFLNLDSLSPLEPWYLISLLEPWSCICSWTFILISSSTLIFYIFHPLFLIFLLILNCDLQSLTFQSLSPCFFFIFHLTSFHFFFFLFQVHVLTYTIHNMLHFMAEKSLIQPGDIGNLPLYLF